MTDASIMELRLELYSNGPLPASTVEQITTLLARRWPEEWDVKIPERPSLEHPAEWRAVVPLPDGMTPETVHRQVEGELSTIDPSGSFHYRTRWSRQESPNHQEVYEVRWTLQRH